MYIHKVYSLHAIHIIDTYYTYIHIHRHAHTHIHMHIIYIYIYMYIHTYNYHPPYIPPTNASFLFPGSWTSCASTCSCWRRTVATPGCRTSRPTATPWTPWRPWRRTARRWRRCCWSRSRRRRQMGTMGKPWENHGKMMVLWDFMVIYALVI